MENEQKLSNIFHGPFGRVFSSLAKDFGLTDENAKWVMKSSDIHKGDILVDLGDPSSGGCF